MPSVIKPLNLGAKTTAGTVPVASAISGKTITSVGTKVTLNSGSWVDNSFVVSKGDYIYDSVNGQVKEIVSFSTDDPKVCFIDTAFAADIAVAVNLTICYPIYKSVTIMNSGAVVGAYQGAPFPAGATLTLNEDPGYGVAPFTYDGTGTTINIFATKQ